MFDVPMDAAPIQEEQVIFCKDEASDYEIQETVFVHRPDLAHYKGSDFAGAVRIERAISVEEAKKIAAEDPQIAYFVYVKGGCMVLEIPPDSPFDLENDPLGLIQHGTYRFENGELSQGPMRVFYHGDAIFFKKEGEWLGSAPGLADVYYKQSF